MASRLPRPDFAALFEAAPVALLVFDRDLTMVHANRAYLDAVGLSLEALAGRHVFDVFPDSPDREGPSQADALRAVLRAVVDRGEVQVLSEYRYDIPAPGGGFEQRVWNVVEVPLLDAAGRVELVLHHTEDVTAFVRARAAREETYRANLDLRREIETAQAAIRDRAAELERLNRRLRRSNARNRSIAETLQRALLGDLPAPDGVRLEGAYRAAANQVGGDWYDAVALPSGTTAVMVGDVVGHDIAAAAAMGQLRSMLRTLVWVDPSDPAAVLDRLDRAVDDLGDAGTTASALLALLDRSSTDDGTPQLTVTWASAGHPPPVLVHPDGTAEVLDSAEDPLLGVGQGLRRTERRTTLAPGALLVLYTDGLVERRGEAIDLGIRRLADTAARHHADPDRVARIVEDMVGDDHEDDVALVVIEPV